jgi:hypothetical protein
MGLGKTLTMISAVVCSRDAAFEFAKHNDHHGKPNSTRATLVVVTSYRMLIPRYPSIHTFLTCVRASTSLAIRDQQVSSLIHGKDGPKLTSKASAGRSFEINRLPRHETCKVIY